MNDFEYDCLQKKRLAQQVKYRKRGSKSKKCPLSTDYMTPKQWKERCGVVLSINMNKPVSWEMFKELTKETQEKYIKHLMDAYGANATSLAVMFDVRPLTVRRYIAAKELQLSFPIGHSMKAEQRLAWEKFLGGEESVDMNPDEDFVQEESLAKTPIDERPQMNMKRVALCFSGKIDVAEISNSLRYILGSNVVGDIEIVCNLS